MVRDVPADYEEELKERARVRPFSRTGDSRCGILGTFPIIALQSHGERKMLTSNPKTLSEMPDSFFPAARI